MVQDYSRLRGKILNEDWKYREISSQTLQNAKRWKWREIKKNIIIFSFLRWMPRIISEFNVKREIILSFLLRRTIVSRRKGERVS